MPVRPKASRTSAFSNAHLEEFPTAVMCWELGVAPSAYSHGLKRAQSALDAEHARSVLSGEATSAASDTTGRVESTRMSLVARNGSIKARSAALCQFGDLLMSAPPVSVSTSPEGRVREGWPV